MSIGQIFTMRNRRFFMGGLVIAVVALAAFGVLAADPPLAYDNTSPEGALLNAQTQGLPVADDCTQIYQDAFPSDPRYDNYYETIEFYVTSAAPTDVTADAPDFNPYLALYTLGTFDPTDPVGCLDAGVSLNVAIEANTVYTLMVSHTGRLPGNNDELGAPGETFTANLSAAVDVCWSDTLGTCEDDDGDNVNNATDNCPTTANADQANNYGSDNEGDACDDSDMDGVLDIDDACPTTNPVTDEDGDGCDDVDDSIGEEITDGGNEIPFYALDGRLNPLNGDNLAVAYEGSDGNGGTSLDLYCVRADSTGMLGLQITQDDLPTTTPDENTLIAQSEICNVSFYVLSSGEYQVNIGPDAEGKVWELIFTSLDMDNLRSQVFVLD